jgi:hypothetical protein
MICNKCHKTMKKDVTRSVFTKQSNPNMLFWLSVIMCFFLIFFYQRIEDSMTISLGEKGSKILFIVSLSFAFFLFGNLFNLIVRTGKSVLK